MKRFSIVILPLLMSGCGPGNQEQQETANLHKQEAGLNAAAAGATPITTGDSILLAGKMESARADHTATLLQNGQVLICGGFSGSPLSSAEIFDPQANRFRPAGHMTVPRSGHSATLLPDGKVLIAGGYNGDYLASTEIFDPATNRFSAGNMMETARSGHTATLLGNGKILFAGGVGTGWSFLPSAALYDIQTGHFAATGSMTTARESHTATLLKNGTVLVTGGHTGRRPRINIYSSAEIYTPSSGRFALTGSMTIIRHKHDAVMLDDGQVLITGGSDARDGRGAYTSAEIYDPASARFQATGDMQLSRYKHKGTSVLLANGQVLLAGGASLAELYDPTTHGFSIVAGDMHSERLFSCATLLPNGQVLITGGYDDHQQVSPLAWIYSSQR